MTPPSITNRHVNNSSVWVNGELLPLSYYTTNNIIRGRTNHYIARENSTNNNTNEDFIPFIDHEQPIEPPVVDPPQPIEPPVEPFVDINLGRNARTTVDITFFEVSEEDRRCCICMEERLSYEICRLNCRHTFCVHCTNQHLQNYHSCPMCRSVISTVTVQNNDARDILDI